MKRIGFTIGVVGGAIAMIPVGVALTSSGASSAPTKTIDATDVNQPVIKCPPGENLNALFTIGGIDNSGDVPPMINVTFKDGDGASFNNFRYDSMGRAPGTPPWARYKGTVPNVGVSGASTQIYSAWNDKFVLEEYFCGNLIPPTTTTTTTSTTSTTTTTSTLPTTSTTTSLPPVTPTTIVQPHPTPVVLPPQPVPAPSVATPGQIEVTG